MAQAQALREWPGGNVKHGRLALRPFLILNFHFKKRLGAKRGLWHSMLWPLHDILLIKGPHVALALNALALHDTLRVKARLAAFVLQTVALRAAIKF